MMHLELQTDRLNGPTSQASMFSRLDVAPHIKHAAQLLWHHAE